MWWINFYGRHLVSLFLVRMIKNYTVCHVRRNMRLINFFFTAFLRASRRRGMCMRSEAGANTLGPFNLLIFYFQLHKHLHKSFAQAASFSNDSLQTILCASQRLDGSIRFHKRVNGFFFGKIFVMKKTRIVREKCEMKRRKNLMPSIQKCHDRARCRDWQWLSLHSASADELIAWNIEHQQAVCHCLGEKLFFLWISTRRVRLLHILISLALCNFNKRYSWLFVCDFFNWICP